MNVQLKQALQIFLLMVKVQRKALQIFLLMAGLKKVLQMAQQMGQADCLKTGDVFV